jgi:hypothetical protein
MNTQRALIAARDTLKTRLTRPPRPGEIFREVYGAEVYLLEAAPARHNFEIGLSVRQGDGRRAPVSSYDLTVAKDIVDTIEAAVPNLGSRYSAEINRRWIRVMAIILDEAAAVVKISKLLGRAVRTATIHDHRDLIFDMVATKSKLANLLPA